ncbi:hypothetical protein CQW49_22365 (plasmid) [Methylosinus trichosporium OB3b]|uniref:Uncharacterized protein n=1 Tax=Methylosinus trichosporium (strain ATCC 35070 / NCIMB 11131 / UNIQEM 75 / OB3b) TaxID=595536 RepID=A0A2D2D6Y4_METT3|nr:hypothetical protein CQW49_22365 [Methylosinus trichosporium OB3b]
MDQLEKGGQSVEPNEVFAARMSDMFEFRLSNGFAREKFSQGTMVVVDPTARKEAKDAEYLSYVPLTRWVDVVQTAQ